MDIVDFDYHLPKRLIAQTPPQERGNSKLLFLDRATGRYVDSHFSHLGKFLQKGDLLVLNNTRVFPARLYGHLIPNNEPVECLLLERVSPDSWNVLTRPARKLQVGSRIKCERAGHSLFLEIVGKGEYGQSTVRIQTGQNCGVDSAVDAIGHTPLPPYVRRPDDASDAERYQTVYAKVRGSIAAPTAGLHFTDQLLQSLTASGIEIHEITLHVGYGTFEPVRVTKVEDHSITAEHFSISEATSSALNAALETRRRIVAVGTTTVRALETAIRLGDGRFRATSDKTTLLIYPGHEFHAVKGLVTNFHLPQSSLLVLTCAFGGREPVLGAYRHAVRNGYRFYSYGDAMLIL